MDPKVLAVEYVLKVLAVVWILKVLAVELAGLEKRCSVEQCCGIGQRAVESKWVLEILDWSYSPRVGFTLSA